MIFRRKPTFNDPTPALVAKMREDAAAILAYLAICKARGLERSRRQIDRERLTEGLPPVIWFDPPSEGLTI